ncbi:hypothetical protein AX16_000222 [Volvariella volvacea WC 439]|nr:hypothetical protein AX16_000222 [Volvariella volvacea WC 439]
MSTTYSGKLLLGATGYIGSQYLVHLKGQYPNVHVTALVRNATDARKLALAQLNPNITVLEGTLDDDALIREHASKSDIVISTAIGYHEPSMRAALAGLEEVSKQRPGNPPLFPRLGIWSFQRSFYGPNDVPEGNIVVGINKEIIAIGERKESPIKTMILFHSWVYGIGNGVQKITAALRPSFNFAKVAGHAVTLGRGLNQFSTIHVKDVANSMIAMIRGALDGTAGTGVQGLYFAGDEFETSPSVKQIQDEIGNVLYELGLVSTPGSQPISLTSPLAQTLPERNAYVIPEKLKKLGVEFVKTKKLTVLQSLRDEVRLAVKEGAWA